VNRPGTFLWHDYETFGTHPALDRPAQFAAIRTDTGLRPIGEPLEWFCAPAEDTLPHPAACLVTGITPQEARRKGVIESEFAGLIHAEMMEPGTCCAGYNNLNFDDEFTRHLFYRNFRDPYEREWRNGNSRWDLIGLARMCYALRPDGVTWPEREPGIPSFRLEDLTAANGIGHAGAHDALADVRATLDLARRIRDAQPRLFEWALGMRDQKRVLRMLDVVSPEPVLHTSGRIPAARGCTSLYLCLAVYPERDKWVIAVDLMSDPDRLIAADADEIADLVFTPTDDLPDGEERIPLKAIKANKIPMLAPMATLKGVDTERIGLDPERCLEHARRILPHLAEIRRKVMDVFFQPPDFTAQDPELMLYGGFFDDHDRRLIARVAAGEPDSLARLELPFHDGRLPNLLFRYRARNFPETLDAAEARRWLEDRRDRLVRNPPDPRAGLGRLKADLAECREINRADGRANRILDQLDAWYRAIEDQLAA